ncbi:GerAB/ArcD/ProY family transporter [Sporomusa sp. KB1]|jgi:hypothetical protein|uniref:GerAB/ArcD/ProY family transporter n=1 Tax=Sporomusa sp. KB1 TaxID=943346 RepID=UPI00119CB572|nr:GerAB/ArcD/ProY family transporter [Sporomusa sp. KB1]TWH51860.1 spore germination protein [Sporomusa sp. KB1]
MSYQPGRMGMAEAIALVFVVTFPGIFLSLPSQTIENFGELSWLVALVSGLTTMAMLFLLIYVFNRIPGDLFYVSKQLLGRFGAWLISIYYIALFFSMDVFWIRQFAENTLITALPGINFQLAVGWYGLSAAVLVYFGIEALARGAYVILPFVIIGILTVFALLGSFYKPYYLFPWQGAGLAATIKQSAIFGINAGALLLLVLASSFQNSRVLKAATIFGLGGSVLLKATAFAAFTMIFGKAVAMEKTLLFFEMARFIYLTRYIQRIESLFIILWVIIGILAIAVTLYIGLYLITRLGNLPTMRPLIPTVTIILTELAMLPPDVNSIITIERVMMNSYYDIGIYIIPLLLFAITMLKGKRRPKCSSE